MTPFEAFNRLIDLRGIKNSYIAQQLNISHTTWYNYKKEPGKLSDHQREIIVRLLRIRLEFLDSIISLDSSIDTNYFEQQVLSQTYH
ncbi:MAG: antitoxin Xre-like helix-turn-helix domain-containing protein [Bacteroidota bacterium]